MTGSLFSNFLTALGVPHTEWYSSQQFRGMTFKSVFGLTKLLQKYGVDSETLRFTDKNEGYADLPVPFLAQLDGCFAIVTEKGPDGVEYSTLTERPGSRMTREAFMDRWTGVALVAYPTERSCEPDVCAHRTTELVRRLVRPAVWASALTVLIGLGLTGGALRSIVTAILLAFNLFGLYVSYMLVQKSSGIHTASADRVCAVIERTGCNTVLGTSASKFFGAVSWSAVGFGYFGVNTAVLLLAPEALRELALLNICCLPFSFWSVWYQRTRAGAWCTLCLLVQGTLWAIFLTDLIGGLISWPPSWASLVILLAAYVGAVLAVNTLSGAFDRLMHNKTL